MQYRFVWNVVAAGLFLSPSFMPVAMAQSGSRSPSASPPAAGSGPRATDPAGSAPRSPGEPTVAMEGYCPVCLVEMRQWIKGDPRIALEFDGKLYYFPEQEQAEMFQKNPLRYVPALGGDDVVHHAQRGERVAGDLRHGVTHEGRVFFFASAQTKQAFQSDPARYAQADLALGGECVVCRHEMSQRVAGSPEFTALHNGLRYHFPGDEQQAMFLAAPDKYLQTAPVPAGSGNRPAATGTRPSAAPRPAAGGSGSR